MVPSKGHGKKNETEGDFGHLKLNTMNILLKFQYPSEVFKLKEC